MAIKRVMGTENEYGILGGSAHQVLHNYHGKSKNHENKSPTNESAVPGMNDVGHFGGDYTGQEMDENLAGNLGFKPSFKHYNGVGLVVTGFQFSNQYPQYQQWNAYSSYFGRDDMLANGARFYIDMGHPEYSTPECSNPVSAVIADKAGEIILERASDFGKIARIFKNNTDGFKSYGSHENYFVDREKVGRFEDLADFMTPFFVSRPIFTGSGKIGFADAKSVQMQEKMQEILDKYGSIEKLAKERVKDLYLRVKEGLEEVIATMREDEIIFHISQRADFFTQLIALQTTYDRPIINTRDEPLSNRKKYMRFHVINGDANLSEIATYLKLGTAALALDLFEDKKIVPMELENPVSAFHAISKDSTLKVKVKTKKNGEMTALEIQKAYFEAARTAYAGRDEMTDDILNRWGYVLDTLQEDPMKLDRWLDWVIKKRLIESYRARTGKKLSETPVRNIDLLYHEVNRQEGLFYMLQNNGMVDRLLTDEQIMHAVDNPPEDTRAYLRGKLIERDMVSSSDWDKISLTEDKGEIELKEPFECTKEKVGHLFEQRNLSNSDLVEELKRMKIVKKRRFFKFKKEYPKSINHAGGEKDDAGVQEI